MVVLFTACSGTSDKATIGFIAPLTGPFAEWGESIKKGVDIGLEDAQHQFEVDYQDSACDPQQTVTIAKKLIEVDNVKIIIGPGCVTGLRAMAPIAEEHGVLLFSTGLLDDQIFEDYSNVINLATQISTEVKHIVTYLDMKAYRKIALVHGTNYFGQEYGKRLPESLHEYDIQVTSIHPSSLDTTDFRTIILTAMRKNPEAIFIHQAELQIGVFVKQLREMGYDLPVYSYYGAEAPSVIEAGMGALEGLEYTYPVNSAEGSEEKERFEKRYGDTLPTATSFFAYDGIMLLDQAIDVCVSFDVACIKKFFKGEYEGLSGLMVFEEDGSLTRPFGIKRYENGSFVWVTKNLDIS